MSRRKRYTKQFKEEALRLMNQEGVSLTQVAEGLGLESRKSVRNHYRQSSPRDRVLWG